MPVLHIVTCEYPPRIGGVSEHSRVLAETAVDAGFEVHVWSTPGGSGSKGIDVHGELGDFSTTALARADRALAEWPAPRRVVVQWVPHGYGRKGLNLAFSRWIRRRARSGDPIDLIVHEPFLDFFGPSWRQPIAALIQRYMTWTVVRAAHRVWLTIPGWEPRLRAARGGGRSAPQMLPVPGTISRVSDPDAVAALRTSLLEGRSRLVGYFGGGGSYPLAAIKATAADLARQDADVSFVCIGRGSDTLARDLRPICPPGIPIAGTGAIESRAVSLHLQACDALLQPYPDGVSGRRTTTVSALEHGVPVATTFGTLSEPFWRNTPAVESVPASAPTTLATALTPLLASSRNAEARRGALALYRERFDPARTLKALLSH